MESSELASILNGYFQWNKARMTCFAGMLIALIKVRTVNLVDLACALDSKATIDSRYKRLKRFFSGFSIDTSCIATWVMNCFGLDQPVYLCLDRTNWQWGKRHINIFMLSVVYKGIALPLYWDLFSHRGNSNTKERIKIVKKFCNQFGKKMIAGLLCDREFVGDKWIKWLQKEKIPFCIRIKENTVTTNTEGRERIVKDLFYALKRDQQETLRLRRKLWNSKAYLSALRLSNGKLLIVATDKQYDDPIKRYGQRWEIETLFGCLKTKGFNFEDTRITHPERINKLIVLLAIGFCWAHKIGEWRHEEKAIVIKKHGRRLQSYFRYGLDYLREALLKSVLICSKKAKLLAPFEALKCLPQGLI